MSALRGPAPCEGCGSVLTSSLGHPAMGCPILAQQGPPAAFCAGSSGSPTTPAGPSDAGEHCERTNPPAQSAASFLTAKGRELTSVAVIRRTHELRVACTTPAPRIASTSRCLCHFRAARSEDRRVPRRTNQPSVSSPGRRWSTAA